MPAEPVGNTTPVTDNKIGQFMSASQNTCNKQNQLNQEYSKRVKPEFSIESAGFQSRKQLKIDSTDRVEMWQALLCWDIGSVFRTDTKISGLC